MKYILLSCLFIIFIGNSIIAQSKSLKSNTDSMIRHTVVFKLKHTKGSAEESSFLKEAGKLAAIPGVQKFECLRQISKKNNFAFGLSMEFSSNEAYEAYNNHPVHIDFVQTYWLKEVEDFLEIDYELIK